MTNLYNIHFCKKQELDKLQNFINRHWREGHVMGNSLELMNFQHSHEGADYYDFAVAENLETGEFDAIYGFIRTWKYDTTHSIPSIGWGAIWKVREDVENPQIGTIALQLMKYIILNGDIDILASLGISKDFKAVAQSLHFTVGRMNHYYIANESISNYKVIVNPLFPTRKEGSCYTMRQLDGIEDIVLPANGLNPNKNITYFLNRYQNHPFYNYIFWGLYDNETLITVLVARLIKIGDNSIYRIMDAIGSLQMTKSIYKPVQDILKKSGAEYVDCMNAGIDKVVFEHLGFVEADYNKTIIPEHLNPLEHKNVPLEYAYSDEENIVIFKGDGDQDRPNRKEELCLRR